MMITIFKGVLLFSVLFVFNLFAGLIYQKGLNRVKNVVIFRFDDVTRFEIISSVIISLVVSSLFTYSFYM